MSYIKVGSSKKQKGDNVTKTRNNVTRFELFSNKTQKGDAATIRINVTTSKEDRKVLNQIVHDDKKILPNYNTDNKNKYDEDLQEKLDDIIIEYDIDLEEYE